jgi:hypothetical protein
LGLLPTDNIDALAAPEPGSFVLLMVGIVGLWFFIFMRRKLQHSR